MVEGAVKNIGLGPASHSMGGPVVLASGVSGVVSCHVKRVKPTDTSDEDIAARNLKSEGCTTTCRRLTADLQDKLYSTPTSTVIQPRHLIQSDVEILGGLQDSQSSQSTPTSRYLGGTCQRGPRCQAAELPIYSDPGSCRPIRVSRLCKKKQGDDIHFQVPVVSPFGRLRTQRRPQSRRSIGLLLLGRR